METPSYQDPSETPELKKISDSAVFEAQQCLKEFKRVYGDEDLLFKRIFDTARLKAKDQCICKAPISRYYEKKGRFKYRCKLCRRTISPLADTPLKGIRVPLTTVFEVVYLTMQGRHGLTAKEISRYHNLNYTTSLHLKHRIQIWMGLVVHAFKFECTTLAVDEAYCKIPTGLGPGIKYNAGLGSQRQKPIVSMVEAGGHERARTFVVDHIDQPTMKRLFREHVDTSTTIFTDGNPVYSFLSEKGYLHFECDHSSKVFSRNGIHVNHAESLHGLLKSKLYHVHRGISEQHLQKYADEITWTFIHRNKTPFDAINSLFEVLPPLNSKIIIEPNNAYNNEK